jgi:hypothetical protein
LEPGTEIVLRIRIMALVCPRCQRANPDIAEFCYNDGALLRQGAGHAPSKLSREFVFPSGKKCSSFEELAQGCMDEWVAARDLLKRGVFGQYFSAVGRLDLARATQEAMNQPDPDIGLTTFLSALPVSRQHVPRLDINPRRILLGNMLAGEAKQIPISISNQGQGTLQGSLKITEGGDWLKPAGAADGQCLIKAPREQEIMLLVDTKKLEAAQTYGGKLTVVTNGGVVEVPIRMDVVAHPFPRPPFQGARTPREMAEKMRGAPKAAVPLLESGEVGRWFKTNGWNYPIPGTPAKGVAGVQQFFEAMGLSKPPPIQASHKILEVDCKYPDVGRGQVSILTNSKKWVYGSVESDSPWLRVLTPIVSGPQQAAIGFEVDTRQVPSRRAEGKLNIVANGGQRLHIVIDVAVQGMPKKAKTKGPLHAVLVMTLALVLLRLALFPFVDMMSRGSAARSAASKMQIELSEDSPLRRVGGWLSMPWNRILLGSAETIPAEVFNPAPGLQGPVVRSEYRHYYVASFIRRVVWWTWWIGALAGGWTLWRRSGAGDVVWGIIAGGVAGIGAAATLACIILVGDALPQIIWGALGMGGNFAMLFFVWLPLVTLFWTMFGVGLGFLCAYVKPCQSLLLKPAQEGLSRLCGLCGLRGLAGYFAPA